MLAVTPPAPCAVVARQWGKPRSIAQKAPYYARPEYFHLDIEQLSLRSKRGLGNQIFMEARLDPVTDDVDCGAVLSFRAGFKVR